MKLIEFTEQTTIIAENQPEYLPLPACQTKDAQGRTIFCWRMTCWERVRILFTGTLWHQVLTFNQPLQPQLLGIDKPDMT